MILKIKNANRLAGTQFWNGIFVFTSAHETDTNYRFQFEDTNSFSKRYVWIEVNRIGKWDVAGNSWSYKLNYMKCPTHIVSANYFEDFNNVIETMGMALRNQ